jgi:hypothetical protein
MSNLFKVGDIVRIISTDDFFKDCYHTHYTIERIEDNKLNHYPIRIISPSGHIMKDVTDKEIELFYDSYEVDL